jgi:hypothetical protein
MVKTVEAVWKEKESDHDDGVASLDKDASLRMRLFHDCRRSLEAVCRKL